MDPEDHEELCNTGPEDETTALQKKRSRRVSFAEITSVHVFDRDEDYETPPDSKPSSDNPESGQANEILGFHRDVGDSDDSKELSQQEDDGEEDEKEQFLRNMDWSSPGSTIGSVTSNEGKFIENFFGPVSASFIRSGQLSDSVASYVNHDITLDSTTFSCHFRSLVQSDSGGDFKTPTGVHLAFEEKTPSQNSTSTTMGSFMVLTGAKKQPYPRSSVSGGKSSGGFDSNMSLIEENPLRYDYGRLSPGLNSLLTEGNKDLLAGSVYDNVNISKSPIHLNRQSMFSTLEHQSGLMDQKDFGDNVLGNVDTNDTPAKMDADASVKLCESNGVSATTPIYKINYGRSLSPKNALALNASIDHQNQTFNGSTQRNPFGMDKASGVDAPKSSELKLGFAAGNSGAFTLPNKFLQTDLFPQLESGYLGSAEDLIKEKSPENEGCTLDIGQNSNQHGRTPLAGSVSSLRAKRRQIFLDTADSSRSGWIGTPFSRKQPSSSLNRETMRHGESVSSIKKSISKFNILETSPFAATLEVGLGNSIPAPSDYLSKPLSFDTSLDENKKDPKLKYMDVFNASLEGNLLRVTQRITEQKSKISMDSYEVETPKSIIIVRQADENTGRVENGECGNHISTGMLCSDQPSKLMAALVSPSNFSGSGKQMQLNPLNPQSPTEEASVTLEPVSSLIEIKIDLKEQRKETSTSNKLICSSKLERKSASPEYQGILSRALKQQDQYNKLVSLDIRQAGMDLRENATNASHLTPTADKLGSLLNEKNANSSSPSNEINSIYPKDIGQWKGMGYRELLHNLKESGNNGGYQMIQTPLRDRATPNSQYGSPDRNLQTGTDPAKFRKKLSDRGLKASSCESASPYVYKRTTIAPQLGKSMVEWVTESSSRKELYNLSQNDNMHQVAGKDPCSPKSIQYSNEHGHSDCYPGLNILQKSFSIQEVGNSSGRKRSSEEIILRDKDHIDEFGRMQKSPKVHEMRGRELKFPWEHSNVRNNEAKNIGGDVFSKFRGATKLLVSTLTDKLNSHELDILEDILVRLQKAKKYEKICFDIQSQTYLFSAKTELINCFPQKTHYIPDNLQQNRVAETRWLLHMLVYEQAKLQLMRVKRERLLKRVHLLNSGIQESQILKNSLHHLCVPGARDHESEDIHLQSLPNSSGKNEDILKALGNSTDACNKVYTMRQEFGGLDKKIKNLTRSFHTSCKMKGEPSSTETIESVYDHLKKGTCCRFIRQELQLWDMDDLESRNSHHTIVLNYQNFLFQRFTINLGSVPSIITSNKLNDIKIMKDFPNISACKAFVFVLNAEATRKHGGPLTQETQITSSLLGNLLDVVEEVKVARLELPNLVQTSFDSPCVEQLDLQLYFIDFRTGRKWNLSLRDPPVSAAFSYLHYTDATVTFAFN
ncbi:hypothetical protein HHK36_003431 [Tetracentron sinense]|uniref:Uncharacterized protein n=1 Tax=Tetracentron sinense TaxID=13715 RepID=A0A834ZN73_TETSI|nr:hypothetical protein HHK36_003431 [Tetracentron sinense]